MAPDDDVPVAAEAAYVHLDASPGDETTVLDAELAVDVDRATWMRGQERKQRVGKGGIVARIVVAARDRAGAAEDVARVVVGDGGAAATAKVVES